MQKNSGSPHSYPMDDLQETQFLDQTQTQKSPESLLEILRKYTESIKDTLKRILKKREPLLDEYLHKLKTSGVTHLQPSELDILFTAAYNKEISHKEIKHALWIFQYRRLSKQLLALIEEDMFLFCTHGTPKKALGTHVPYPQLLAYLLKKCAENIQKDQKITTLLTSLIDALDDPHPQNITTLEQKIQTLVKEHIIMTVKKIPRNLQDKLVLSYYRQHIEPKLDQDSLIWSETYLPQSESKESG